CMQDLEFPYSF
nr:immunoglobulin light chain junction region [Macaca mulatta]MOW14127.1 immunoglobulin light chain junction region [Macaca mulatta]